MSLICSVYMDKNDGMLLTKRLLRTINSCGIAELHANMKTNNDPLSIPLTTLNANSRAISEKLKAHRI